MPEVVGIADEHLAILLALTGMHVEEVRDPAAAQDFLALLLASEAKFVIVVIRPAVGYEIRLE